MGHVYRITNLINGKLYIGLTTTTLEKRWKKHIKDATVSNRPHAIHNAIRKYGAESFFITSLFETNDLKTLNHVEKMMIESNNSMYPNGYNLHGGGNAHSISEYTRLLMSVAQRGKKQSEETKTKRSVRLSGRKQPLHLVEQRAKSRSRPIIELQSGRTFESINSAAKYLGIKARGISKNLHGQSNHYFGFKFKFMENICK